MRITVGIDPGLLEQAKRTAAARRETLSSLIERGLRLVLAESYSPAQIALARLLKHG